MDERLVYPLFDVSMWPVVSSAGVLTHLQPETTDALMHSYNRMATANERYEFLLDLSQGRTGLLVTMAAAPSLEEEPVKDLYQRYLDYRSYTRRGIIERLNELKPRLDAAIDAVEAELGLEVENTAAQRTYVSETPPGYVD